MTMTISMLSALAISTMLMAGCPPLAALAQDQTQVREVDEKADLSAIKNPRAARYWSNIADDLNDAILTRVSDRIADDGVDIHVDLSSVELANTFENLTNVANSRIAGKVHITSKTDNSAFHSYELAVSFKPALPYVQPGSNVTIIAVDNRDYYSAMINAFAQAVVDRL